MADVAVPRARIALVVFTGLAAVSFAAILIRWCDAPALSIAAYRLMLSSLFLLTVGAAKLPRVFTGLAPGDWLIGAISGAFLAMHFATWIKSLEMTSVASSVVLISTSPFFVAFGAWLIFGKRVPRLFQIGLLVAFFGMFLVARDDISIGRDSLFGDLEAVLGALAMAGYMLCGRYLRARVDTFTYIVLSYTFAAIILVILAILTTAPLYGFALDVYLLFILIAFVPQLIGHTSFNWSLKHLSAPLVSTIMLGEPIFATILAFFLLSEVPSLAKIAGSVLILFGVFMAILSESDQLKSRK